MQHRRKGHLFGSTEKPVEQWMVELFDKLIDSEDGNFAKWIATVFSLLVLFVKEKKKKKIYISVYLFLYMENTHETSGKNFSWGF